MYHHESIMHMFHAKVLSIEIIKGPTNVLVCIRSIHFSDVKFKGLMFLIFHLINYSEPKKIFI